MRPEHRAPATLLDHPLGTAMDEGVAYVAPAGRPLLVGALEASDHFHRDTPLGSIFHPGKISFREISMVDSVHFLIDGNRVTAHVDQISPLWPKSGDSITYSLRRVLAHNLSAACAEVARRMRGTNGQQRCNLECEVVWIDDDPACAE